MEKQSHAPNVRVMYALLDNIKVQIETRFYVHITNK
jgi:hypothetical protein